eukprot:Platyproteum_vivax@DN124_c0_g1_i1.p1
MIVGRTAHQLVHKCLRNLPVVRSASTFRMTFFKESKPTTVPFTEGQSVLDVALDNGIDIEGACGGQCACSTCHIIFKKTEDYERMEKPDDDELDMLDLALGVTETSRLGCQITLTKEDNGLEVKLPHNTHNAMMS